MSKKRKRIWKVFYGSDRLTWKEQRRKAKVTLRQGKEPEPDLHTGKYWTD